MSKKKVGMTVREAVEEAQKTFSVSMGEQGTYFTAIGWESPETGQKTGPFFVCIVDGLAIEVDKDGKFRDFYSAKAEHYFPFFSADIKTERP